MTDRSVLVRLKLNPAAYIAGAKAASAATKDLYNDINTTNERTAWLAQGILAIVPAATTMGAGAVPVISGLATQMTVAAGAAGTLALAFNGVGDGLKALNAYQLEPTAANLDKLDQAMAKIGPDGEEFVRFIDSLSPALAELANTARGGIFPGMEDGIRDLMTLAPQVERIVGNIAQGIGELSADAGAGLSGEGFEAFFNYLETDAKPILIDMGHTIGNFAEGLANMMVAFAPVSADFTSGLDDMARSFADWSAGLSSSSGFQEFLDYVQDAGPKALDFLQALASALIEIVEAAAPVGALMLPVLTRLLDIIGALADTPLGPLVIGFVSLTSAIGRLRALGELTGSGVMSKMTKGIRENTTATREAVPTLQTFGTAMYRAGQSADEQSEKTRKAMGSVKEFGRTVAPLAAQAALLGVAMTGTADKMGLSNTVSLALAGSLMGPVGAGLGAAAGAAMDFAAANNNVFDSLEALQSALDRTHTNASASTIDQLTEQAAMAREQVNELAATLNSDDWNLEWAAAGAKNAVEGLFGKSDYEEAYAAMQKAQAELDELTAAQEQAAASDSYRQSVEAQTEAIEYNTEAMRTNRSEKLRDLNAELNYKTAVLDARDAAKEHGKVLKSNGDLMRTNQRAGIDAKQMLYGMAAGWNDLSQAEKNARGGHRAAINDFIDVAQSMGMSRKAARDLAEAIYEIPTNRNIKVKLDTGTARGDIARLREELRNIPDETVSVRVVRGNVVASNSRMPGPQDALENAVGGIYSDMPNRHQPQIARANGRMRVWAEPETQGESYIPHANDARRPRAKAILEKTAGMFGGSVQWFANGGMTGTNEENLAILQAVKAIRDIQRELRADGKDRIKGLARQIKLAELLTARDALTEARANVGAEQREAAAEAAEKAAEAQQAAAEAQIDAAKAQVDAANEQMQAITQQREAVENAVVSNMTPSLIGAGTTFSGFMTESGKAGNRNSAIEQTVAALIAAGLDGPLLQEAASKGDLRFLTQMLAAGPAGIDQAERQYAAVGASAQRTGELVGLREFGAAQAVIAEQQMAATLQLVEANHNLVNIGLSLQSQPWLVAAGVANAVNAGSTAAKTHNTMTRRGGFRGNSW